jgi:hypothetical protein
VLPHDLVPNLRLGIPLVPLCRLPKASNCLELATTTMKQSLILLSSLLSLVQSTLLERQTASQTDYINSVCSPNVTVTPGVTLPPCISINNIQGQCAPNGTAPLDYLASAECICNPPSTFFADWQGCQNCLFVHGARSQQDKDTYSVVISSVSQALCTGTPTADFAALFSTIAGQVSRVTTGASISSDQYPSQTAVSFYYTASGTQGPGAITGQCFGS